MLLSEGYFVTATYAHDEDTAKKFETLFPNEVEHFELLKIDQSNKADVQLLAEHVKQHGPLDCLVCNAGMTLRKGITDFTDEEWEKVMQVYVNASVFLTRDLYSCISNNARIVFIGSEMGAILMAHH